MIIDRILTQGAFAERYEADGDGDDDDDDEEGRGASGGGKKKSKGPKDVMQGIGMMTPCKPMLALACKSTGFCHL